MLLGLLIKLLEFKLFVLEFDRFELFAHSEYSEPIINFQIEATFKRLHVPLRHVFIDVLVNLYSDSKYEICKQSW